MGCITLYTLHIHIHVTVCVIPVVTLPVCEVHVVLYIHTFIIPGIVYCMHIMFVIHVSHKYNTGKAGGTSVGPLAMMVSFRP